MLTGRGCNAALQAPLAPRLYDHCMKHHPEEGMTFNVFVEAISIVCLGSINARLALIVGTLDLGLILATLSALLGCIPFHIRRELCFS